jgi:hypothetical protein
MRINDCNRGGKVYLYTSSCRDWLIYIEVDPQLCFSFTFVIILTCIRSGINLHSITKASDELIPAGWSDLYGLSSHVSILIPYFGYHVSLILTYCIGIINIDIDIKIRAANYMYYDVVDIGKREA